MRPTADESHLRGASMDLSPYKRGRMTVSSEIGSEKPILNRVEVGFLTHPCSQGIQRGAPQGHRRGGEREGGYKQTESGAN